MKTSRPVERILDRATFCCYSHAMQIKTLNPGTKLELTTSGHLEVVFLGVGSAFATKNYNTNFLLMCGDDHILVDFGMTGPMALRQNCGLSPTDIQCVVPTHVHADHVGGFEQLALMHRFITKTRPNCILSYDLQQNLWNHTLRGGLQYLDGSDRRRFEDYFQVLRPSASGSITYGDLHLKFFPTTHIRTPANEDDFLSYAISVNDKVFFSCDTIFDEELFMQHKNCDALFLDCGLYPTSPDLVHPSIDQLRSLPETIKRKTWLVHYGDNYVEYDVSDFQGYAQTGVRYVFENQ